MSSRFASALEALALALTVTSAACAPAGPTNDASTLDGGDASDAATAGDVLDGAMSTEAGDAREAGDAPRTEGGSGATAVVVNEVNAQGSDWVELFNAGRSSVDLSMHQLADSNTDGTPRVERALRFPSGTMIAPGAFLFVRADVATVDGGVQTDCAPAAAPCFHIDWGISASNGETVFLLAPDGTVLDRAVYPPNGAPAGKTLARIPDGQGALVPATPTPGASNRAP